MQEYRSNGKLLLTGEYTVLDGAVALAVPTKQGQSLSVTPTTTAHIEWLSYDAENVLWFSTIIDLDTILTTRLDRIVPDTPTSRLLQILVAIQHLNPSFFKSNIGYKITTHLEFPRQWGLGTSSTLIANLAQWSNVSPYKLLQLTFGGSGYDIACASNNTPISYQVIPKLAPKVTPVTFAPPFIDHLYFVYLNKKQNSRDGIAHYRALQKSALKHAIVEINTITEAFITCTTLAAFHKLIASHETIMAQLTQQNTVKSLFFKDFEGSIKSLGAWGGDFVLAASKTNPTAYFKAKGFDTVVPYRDMVL